MNRNQHCETVYHPRRIWHLSLSGHTFYRRDHAENMHYAPVRIVQKSMFAFPGAVKNSQNTKNYFTLYHNRRNISSSPCLCSAACCRLPVWSPMLQCSSVPGWLLSPVTTTMAIVKRIKNISKI